MKRRLLDTLNLFRGGDDSKPPPAKLPKPLEWTVITGERFEWRVGRKGFVAHEAPAPHKIPLFPPVPVLTLSVGSSLKWPSVWRVRITRTENQGLLGIKKVFLGIFICPKELPPATANFPKNVYGLFSAKIVHPTVPSKTLFVDGSNYPWEITKKKSWGCYKVLDLNRLEEFFHPDGNLVILGDFRLQKEKEPVDDFWATIKKFRDETYYAWRQDLLRELWKPEFMDIKIQTSDGHIFEGHKTILAARSRKLAEELKKLPGDVDILMIAEPWEVFRHVLCFIYNGHFNKMLWDSEKITHDLWLQIRKAAKRYNQDDLAEFLMLRPMSLPPPQHSKMEPAVGAESAVGNETSGVGGTESVDGSVAGVP